jgi:hypothetical protein
MRKLIVAAVLALALTASTRQEAAAGDGCWNFGVGVNVGFSFSWQSSGCCNNPCNGNGNCRGQNPFLCPPQPCAQPYYPYPAYGWYSPICNTPPEGAAHAPAAAAPAASHTQQVGYYYYGQGYAPSYWYGY